MRRLTDLDRLPVFVQRLGPESRARIRPSDALRACLIPRRPAAAAACTFLILTIAPAFAQQGRVTRVPPGTPRIGTARPGPAIPTERNATGAPFRGPIAFPSAGRRWIRLTTPHYIILSNAGTRRTKATAHDLERLTGLLITTSEQFAVPAEPTRIVLFGDSGEIRPYLAAIRGFEVDAAGITFRHERRSTLLIDAGMRGGDVSTPRHELIHDLLRSSDPLPLWIEEGLAEYYSHAGMLVREHVSRLRGRLAVSIEQMLILGTSSPAAASHDFYAASWAAVSTLLRRDRSSFFQLVRDVRGGISSRAALQSRFQMSPQDLAVAMRRAATPSPSILPRSIPVVIEEVPVTRAELLFELGDLLASVPGRAGESERHFLAALEESPDDAEIHLRYAELLSAIPGRSGDARVHAHRAREHQASSERVSAAIGVSYAIEGRFGNAIPHLEQAHATPGASSQIALQLFAAYLENGDLASAGRILPSLLESPHALDARRILLRIAKKQAASLEKAGRLDQAAATLRRIAREMPLASHDLEAEATRLETLPTARDF